MRVTGVKGGAHLGRTGTGNVLAYITLTMNSTTRSVRLSCWQAGARRSHNDDECVRGPKAWCIRLFIAHQNSYTIANKREALQTPSSVFYKAANWKWKPRWVMSGEIWCHWWKARLLLKTVQFFISARKRSYLLLLIANPFGAKYHLQCNYRENKEKRKTLKTQGQNKWNTEGKVHGHWPALVTV